MSSRNGNSKTKHLVVAPRPDTRPDAPSHVPGVREGNHGPHHGTRKTAEEQADARRATGIAPDEHGPIDPKMPKLPPA